MNYDLFIKLGSAYALYMGIVYKNIFLSGPYDHKDSESKWVF